jgi:RNA recognition motif-containing protein
MNIYVGNLPFHASEDDIKELFEAYGQVTSVSVIKDKYTGQSRGFGFVEMPNTNEGQSAIQELNGREFMERKLVVNPARPREERGPGGSGKGGYDNKKRGHQRRGW